MSAMSRKCEDKMRGFRVLPHIAARARAKRRSLKNHISQIPSWNSSCSVGYTPPGVLQMQARERLERRAEQRGHGEGLCAASIPEEGPHRDGLTYTLPHSHNRAGTGQRQRTAPVSVLRPLLCLPRDRSCVRPETAPVSAPRPLPCLPRDRSCVCPETAPVSAPRPLLCLPRDRSCVCPQTAPVSALRPLLCLPRDRSCVCPGTAPVPLLCLPRDRSCICPETARVSALRLLLCLPRDRSCVCPQTAPVSAPGPLLCLP
ncbi:keratinocyte proline-rich protein-like [Conger conger]|uniref:keratinocyte proline-rich protein-like n=1 Tax=Conger conger TaxID=82655 RepID=UPI002A59EF56|nr:keratinocyte proline-rich protein-like [Conger conger]